MVVAIIEIEICHQEVIQGLRCRNEAVIYQIEAVRYQNEAVICQNEDVLAIEIWTDRNAIHLQFRRKGVVVQRDTGLENACREHPKCELKDHDHARRNRQDQGHL